MDVRADLDCLNFRGPTAPTIENLHGLHRPHMLGVPFENLGIHLGRRVMLSETRLIISTSGNREERVLADEQEYAAVLKERFRIVL